MNISIRSYSIVFISVISTVLSRIHNELQCCATRWRHTGCGVNTASQLVLSRVALSWVAIWCVYDHATRL